MWPHTAGGHEVKGVIAVDVRGLAGLLRVTGPVEVDGVTYTADTIEQQLLQDQYVAFDTAAERRDRLGEVAAAVFDSLERSRWPVDVLADEIWRAVVLRHLIVWSKDPKEAEAWRLAGADGSLDARSLAVSVINRGANKLDQFLATTSTVSTRRLPDGRTKVSIAIRLENQTPDGQPTYVAGPNGAGQGGEPLRRRGQRERAGRGVATCVSRAACTRRSTVGTARRGSSPHSSRCRRTDRSRSTRRSCSRPT